MGGGIIGKWGFELNLRKWNQLIVCVCVCVSERERERA